MPVLLDLPPKMQEAFARYAKEFNVPQEKLMLAALDFYLEDVEDALAARTAYKQEECVTLDEMKKEIACEG